MANKILIVSEKPSVGRDLAKALPGSFQSGADGAWLENDDYVISWSIGHLLGLAEPDGYDPKYKRWRIADLPIIPDAFKLKSLGGRGAKQLKVLTKLLKRSDIDQLINACDAGREGELIFAYLYQHARSKKPVQRLWLSSLTQTAITKAFADLRSGAELADLEAAARSRAEADWIVGMNATRAASIRLRPAFGEVVSLGRVQTPTLALLVRRELEIKNFVSEPYWLVEAEFSRSKETTGDADKYLGRYMGGRRLDDVSEALKIVAETNGKPGKITKLEQKAFKEPPPFLYDLTTLQREANSKFGFTAKRTLAAAQKLYEQHKALTYPRTSSRFLPTDFIEQIQPVSKTLLGSHHDNAAKFLCAQQKLRLDRAINDAKISDHHAIVPTLQPPEDLPADEEKIYDLVVRRFLAVFHPDAEGLRTRVETTVAGHVFRSSGKVYHHLGWRAVYGQMTDDGKKNEDELKDQQLPELSKGEAVITDRSYKLDKETQPPRRFSDASLLGAMEAAGKDLDDEELREAMKESGIGTPATRASIIDRLIDVNYIEREQRSFVATEKGVKVIELLGAHPLTSAELTGSWEKRLGEIERHQEQRDKFMADIAGFTKQTVDQLDKLQPPEFDRETLGPCPHCGRPVTENRKGYSCWSKEDPGCGFVIWKVVTGKRLPKSVIVELYTSGETKEPVSGFKSKGKGRTFKARLKMVKKSGGGWQTVFNEDWAGEAGNKTAAKK